MVDKQELQNLGIDGFPAERGLYESVLKNSGLHKSSNMLAWEFCAPSDSGTMVERSFVDMWEAAHDQIRKADGQVRLSDLYTVWSSEPYGVRRGVLPLLALALILERTNEIALYSEEIFVPEVDNFFVDLLLQDPKLITLREIDFSQGTKRLLKEFRTAANKVRRL